MVSDAPGVTIGAAMMARDRRLLRRLPVRFGLDRAAQSGDGILRRVAKFPKIERATSSSENHAWGFLIGTPNCPDWSAAGSGLRIEDLRIRGDRVPITAYDVSSISWHFRFRSISAIVPWRKMAWSTRR